jgi:hypothetical protein
MVFALFDPNDELTALFRIAGVVIWVVAAFASGRFGRRVGGAVGLVALGLAVFFFPTMWQEADAAFGDSATP